MHAFDALRRLSRGLKVSCSKAGKGGRPEPADRFTRTCRRPRPSWTQGHRPLLHPNEHNRAAVTGRPASKRARERTSRPSLDLVYNTVPAASGFVACAARMMVCWSGKEGGRTREGRSVLSMQRWPTRVSPPFRIAAGRRSFFPFSANRPPRAYVSFLHRTELRRAASGGYVPSCPGLGRLSGVSPPARARPPPFPLSSLSAPRSCNRGKENL